MFCVNVLSVLPKFFTTKKEKPRILAVKSLSYDFDTSQGHIEHNLAQQLILNAQIHSRDILYIRATNGFEFRVILLE